MSTVPMTVHERIPMPAHVTGQPAGGEGGLNVGDIIRILKQRMFMILFIWLVISGMAVGGTFYLLRNHPLYQAQAMIRVESPSMKNPMELAERPAQRDAFERFINDQITLLKDEQTLRDTLQDAAVTATHWYKSIGDSQEALDQLGSKLSVFQSRNSSFVVISFQSRKPEDAPVIVNTVKTKYMNRIQESSSSELKQELSSLGKQEDDFKEKLKTIRLEKQNFIQARMGTTGIASGINVVGETWSTLAQEVTRLESEKLQYKTAYENLSSVNPSEIAISPKLMQSINQDPQVVALQNQLLSLDQERQALIEQGLGGKNRAVLAIDARQTAVQSKLNDVQGKLEMEIRENEVDSAYSMFLNAAQAELQLRERLAEAESKQEDFERNLAEYQSLELQQQEIMEQLRQLRYFKNTLQMVINEQGGVRVRDASKAFVPHRPSFPNPKITIPAGSLLGLLLGIGLAVLLEFIDTSVKTTRDIARYIHLPILGTVPDLDDEEVDIEQIETATHSAPRSMVAEAFRTFRTNLLLSAPVEQQRSLLVTSAKPEDGKTTVALNLAISIGQSGRRVLLVDANFHRPRLKELFPNEHAEGLSNVLIGQRSLDDDQLIASTSLPNLDILHSGPIPPNPAELLAGSYMEEFLQKAGERYDQVIIDGPPVLLLSDALVMTSMVNGVVLVCRAKASLRGVVQRARDQLERVNGRVLGAVLNATQISRGGYFREQMRSYYDYQPAEVIASEGARSLPEEQQQLDHDDQDDQDLDQEGKPE